MPAGDRQELHERIRKHAIEAARRIKEEGKENDLLERIGNDPSFFKIKSRLREISEPGKLVGRAPQQVEEFTRQVIEPLLKRYNHLIDKKLIPALTV